jgi:hypothetical protein
MAMKTGGPTFRVGDRVRVRFGPQRPVGTIIEDRGFISSGGGRLFRVRLKFDRTNTIEMGVPEDELTAANRSS